MGTKTYSRKIDGEKNISKDFKVKEFACHDGSDKILISDETVKKLQVARDYFGKPIRINSAYRTSVYNKKVGGTSASQHVKGTACDIAIDGIPSAAIAAYFEKFYPSSGIGLYGTFVHIDSRGYKSYWKDKSNGVVSSFKQGNLYEKYKAKDEMTLDEINKIATVYLDNLKKEKPHDYSKKERTWAEEEKLITGDENGLKYRMFITREELTVILNRYTDYLINKVINK